MCPTTRSFRCLISRDLILESNPGSWLSVPVPSLHFQGLEHVHTVTFNLKRALATAAPHKGSYQGGFISFSQNFHQSIPKRHTQTFRQQWYYCSTMSGSIPLEEVAQADQSRQCHPHSFGLVNSLEEENVRNGDQHAKGTSHLVDRDRYGDSHEEEGYVPGQRSSEAQTLLEHRSTASQHLRASKDDRVKVLGVSVSSISTSM
jgi:hypothetical protein